jgi:hypothetical protein
MHLFQNSQNTDARGSTFNHVSQIHGGQVNFNQVNLYVNNAGAMKCYSYAVL